MPILTPCADAGAPASTLLAATATAANGISLALPIMVSSRFLGFVREEPQTSLATDMSPAGWDFEPDFGRGATRKRGRPALPSLESSADQRPFAAPRRRDPIGAGRQPDGFVELAVGGP